MRTSMARLKQASHPNSRASSRIGGAPMPQLPTTLRVERILALPKARCRISVTLSCHALWATHTMEWWALVVVIPATTIFIGVSAACTQTGGHSTKVGVIAGHNIYGKWEDYDNQRLPLLDACGAHIGPTPESSTAVYHYHAQDKAPFTVGCHGPSASGGLVSVATCRSLYSDCDNDGGSGTTIQTKTGSISYDRFCPCFDATGSNMGTNIQELPALSSTEIYYTVDSNATTSSTTLLGASIDDASRWGFSALLLTAWTFL